MPVQQAARDIPAPTPNSDRSGVKTPMPNTIMMVKMLSEEPLSHIMSMVVSTFFAGP